MGTTTPEILAQDLQHRLDGTLYAHTPRALRAWRLARFDRRMGSGDGCAVLRAFFASGTATAVGTCRAHTHSVAQPARG